MLERDQENIRQHNIEMNMKNVFMSASRELGMNESDFVKLANELCLESYTLENIYRCLQMDTAVKLCEYLCIDLGMLQYSYNQLVHHRLITNAIKNDQFKLPMNEKIWEIYQENFNDFHGSFPKLESTLEPRPVF